MKRISRLIFLGVLIESDWNLKRMQDRSSHPVQAVLIESDWNLKSLFIDVFFFLGSSINRIRLEFKVGRAKFYKNLVDVLIESDWNLKKFI